MQFPTKDDCFVVDIPPKIKSEHELMHAYYKKLVPPYFGFNWDALRDILRDMEWITKKNILILHMDIPKISIKEKKIYIKLLNDAISSWEEDILHKLFVAFPIKHKNEIQKLLGAIKNNLYFQDEKII